MRTLVAAAAAVLAASPMAAGGAAAQTTPQAAHAPQIEDTLLSISARGEIVAAPDMATVSLGVISEGRTAQEAMRSNAQQMNGAIQALRRAGVAERDIQTSGLSLSPQYVYVENQSPRISGYMANNTVTARVRDLDSLGATLDSVVAAGGNTLNGVSFGMQDEDEALNAARRAAVLEARARADLYAEAAGLRVHGILSIAEAGAPMPPPMPYAMMERSMAADMATPIAPGEISTEMHVTVHFELR